MRGLITGNVHGDDEVRGAIAELHRRYGYVADPHTAIAYLGTQASRHPNTPAPQHLFLATAHPAKFRDVVEPAIGETVPLPGALAEAIARPRMVTRIGPALGQLANLL